MRTQKFNITQYSRAVLFFLLMLIWPVFSVQAVGLSEDQKSHSYSTPLLLAQNQGEDSGSESLGEIVSLDTREEGQSSIISIESNKPVQYTAFKLLNPLRLVLDFPKMDQGNLTSRIQVDKGIVDSIRPIHFKEADVLRLEIVLKQSVDYDIKKPEKNKLIISLQSSDRIQNRELARSTPSGSKSSEVTKKEEDLSVAGLKDDGNRDTCFPMLYGEKEKISLDFQNADARNFFRTFSEISGFNIIISPEVSGTLSIRLKDVPWNEALEISLSNINLGRECFDNNFVRIVSNAVLASEESARVDEKARAVADRANERNAQPLVTEVIRINNANITDLSTSLSALKSNRTDAKITVDVRTNTLILNDLRQHVNDMLETIRVLDVPTSQISIESKIVNISKNYAQRLGIQWGLNRAVDNSGIGQTIAATGPDGGNFMVNLGQSSLTAGGISGFDLTLGNFLNGAQLNLALQALETEGKTRILSNPRVVVADNKEARIASGKQIPYQVTSAEGNSINFANAELSLTVVPHVTSDERIYMTIDTTKNSVDESDTVNGVPVVDSKETHTEVLVGNGETTVLAGLYESTIDENRSNVPLFSEIPFLGNFFKNYTDTDTISELMVFITPTIVEMN